MAAIIHALLHTPEGSSVLVRSDSENGIALLTGTVRSKKDWDLVQLYRQTIRDRRLRVSLEWIRSHSGDPWNDYVDNLCIEALDLFEADGTRVREGVDPHALYAYLCSLLQMAITFLTGMVVISTSRIRVRVAETE